MKKSSKLFVISLTALCFLCGCQKNQEIKTVDKICISNADSRAVMQSSRNVLAKMNFAVDKYDSNKLYILTRPLPAAQFFEFWRNDNVGSFNNAEANLHSIRRTVELKFTQNQGQTCCFCNVSTQRLSLSQPADSSSAIKYDRFADHTLAVSTDDMELTAANQRWLNIGSDKKLASLILHKIQKKFEKQ